MSEARFEHRGSTGGNSDSRGAAFGELTPLEYIAVADRERPHTEILRWLLDSDSPLTQSGKRRLLVDLLKAEEGEPDALSAWTEHNRIDLFVKLADGSCIAVENKLKSAEHSSQLRRYDDELKDRNCRRKLFLTLVEQHNVSSEAWQPVTYEDLHSTVVRLLADPLSIKHHHEFLRDYVHLLGRLVSAANHTICNPDVYAANGIVFGHTVTPRTEADVDKFRAYVERMKLRTILQKAWMFALGQAVMAEESSPDAEWSVGETRGEAHLGFIMKRITIDSDQFEVGLQLQHGSFKVYCAPCDYSGPASAAVHRGVQSVLTEIGKIMAATSRFSPARTKGFRSFKHTPIDVSGTLEIDRWRDACLQVLQELSVATQTFRVDRGSAPSTRRPPG